jgi:hypothetical protein
VKHADVEQFTNVSFGNVSLGSKTDATDRGNGSVCCPS